VATAGGRGGAWAPVSLFLFAFRFWVLGRIGLLGF
jgi:hypothetical protein